MEVLFPILLLVIGIYVLYSAIRGKGRLFQAEFIKEKFQDSYIKILRSLYLALGLVMVFQVLASYSVNFIYDVKYTFSFTADWTDKDGVVHTPGPEYSQDEMLEIVATPVPDENAPAATAAPVAAGSLCFPSESGETFPVKQTANYDDVKIPALSFLKPELLSVLSTVLMFVALALLIGIFVAINIMTDKELRREAQAEIRRDSSTLPSAAFEFDEKDEEKK